MLTELTYKFLASIPCSETLGARGRRLNDTAVQRQEKTYAPDVFVEVETEGCGQRLDASFVQDEQVALIQGERKRLELWVNNTGVEDVNEIWMISGPENVVWIEKSATENPAGGTSAIEANETNLLFRFERGGFPVTKQHLEPRPVKNTNQGLHRVGGIETWRILQTSRALPRGQGGRWEHLSDVRLPSGTFTLPGGEAKF